MSKLPNAPLIEVIFEIRWDFNAPEQFNDQQLIVGALNSYFKERFSHREVIQSPFGANAIVIGNAMYRFKNSNDYPLVQIGPGVISFNTNGETYEWQDFFGFINDNLAGSFKYLDSVEKFLIRLSYFDFFPLNGENPIDFVNKNFNINIDNRIATLHNPTGINFSFVKAIDIGNIFYTLNTGDVLGESGIIMQTIIGSNNIATDNINDILGWYSGAHDISSSLFKEVTEGKLYNSFK